MKRFLALLLALCMVFALVACGKTDTTDGTGATKNQAANNEETEWTYVHEVNTGNFAVEELVTGTGMNATSTEILNNDDLVNPEKFAGKKLQIYGYSSATYEDIDEMGKGTFIWMVRAAVADWAALNQVEVEFIGGFDQNVIMGDINAGGNPDLLIYANKFPAPATSGIIRPFTEDEYAQLAKTCGNYYLDMLKYKGQSYGVQSPWSGGTLCYYNKTVFENYGVKSPGEYFMEGNWNWDTYEKCMTEITRDLDGDGKMDIYGSGTHHALLGMHRYRLNDDGKLESLVRNSPEIKRWLEIQYKGHKETHALGSYADCTIATTPRPALHMGDAEWYNFEHLNQTLVNGDLVECVPVPKFTNESESWYSHTIVYSSILTSCDESEATLSLLNYILRVGMRYISDFSLGLYKCNYEGIRGACKYSYQWKQNFKQIVADRQEAFDALEDWDQELYEKMQYEVLNADNHRIGLNIPGQPDNGSTLGSEATSMPPASSLPVIAAREEAWINEYNNLYAN